MAKTDTKPRDLGPSFELIVGERLSDVAFVLDHWQLQFDGPSINIMAPIALHSGGVTLQDSDFRFREHLCGWIDKAVTGTELSETALTVTLDDHSTISISLRKEDRHGPEAILFFDASRKLVAAI
jgi:hypothetical protein